jgi:predicted secreted protein
LQSDKNGLLRFQTADENPEKLPQSFGGLSGSGLWRIHYVDHGDGKCEIIEKRLWGITSWQMDKENNTGAVVGQGWDRIDQGLVPVVRDKL